MITTNKVNILTRSAAASLLLIAMLLTAALASAQTAQDFGYGAMTVNGKPATGGRKVQIIVASVAGSPSFTQPASYYQCMVFGECTGTIPRNVRDYSREVSSGAFTWEKAGPPISVALPSNIGNMFDRNTLSRVVEMALVQAYGSAAPWSPIDAGLWANLMMFSPGDNKITADELSFLVIHNTTANDGNTSDICFTMQRAPMDVCTQVSSVGYHPSLMLIAHELTHQLGAIDIYSGQCDSCMNSRLSLMAANTGADDMSTFHLDPWHKIQLGWANPLIRDLRTPGNDYAGPADRSNPIILYDSWRGPGEFFIIEYRRRFGYDRDVAGEGLAVWHVQNGPTHGATVMRAPLEYAVYHAGAPTLARGRNTLWGSATVTPTLQWNDGTNTLYKIAVDPFYPNPPGISFSWSNKNPLNLQTPRSVAHHTVSLASYNGDFVIARDGGGSSLNATSVNAWSFEQLLITDINGGELMSGDSIYLQTFTGHYISAEGGAGQALVATRTVPGAWATFVIRRIDGAGPIRSMDAVSLQAPNQQYVAAEGGGGGPLNANRNAVGGWEKFTIVTRSVAALRAYNGQYLTAENGGGDTVNANRNFPGGWEWFNFEVAWGDGSGGLLIHDTPVNIRTNNGLYWLAEGGGGGRVNANITVPGVFEQFAIEKVSGSPGDIIRNGDFIALRTIAGNQYVVAENGGGREVNANRMVRGGWETFRVTFYPLQ